MKLTLHGGFGEKGRTCIGVESGGVRLLLDVGINTSGQGAAYYPDLTPADLARIHAVVVTHAHEDHVGALGWCYANGLTGASCMTPETQRGAPEIWRDYSEPDHARLAGQADIRRIAPGRRFEIGSFSILTGRSGHIAGGVWLHVEDEAGASLAYCGDIVPDSPVFPMDPMPGADALILDASYGEDDMPFAERAHQIKAWVADHPSPVLPTPLSGRSLELMAILDMPLAIEVSMRQPLALQIVDEAWIRPSMAALLRLKLDAALDWSIEDPPPGRPILCHDAMGMNGPSRAILKRAMAERWPVLFTGHLPEGSPGADMLAQAKADWLRLPTHPILSENIAMAANGAPRLVLGHSTELKTLRGLSRYIPKLKTEAGVGDAFDI